MKDQRKNPRFPAALQAKYSLHGKSTKHTCRITDINGSGLKVELDKNGKITIGSDLQLSIKVPTSASSIRSNATVLWMHEEDISEDDKRYIFGCRFSQIKPKDKWSLLDYAYDN